MQRIGTVTESVDQCRKDWLIHKITLEYPQVEFKKSRQM